MSKATLAQLESEVGQLVERRSAGSSLTDADRRRYQRLGPVAFGRERLGSDYWARQEDILNAAWKEPRVAVRSANSMGKNFATADLMVWWVHIVGGSVLYMSSADRQLNIGMKELRRALRGSGLPFELYHRRLRVGGEDRIYAFTSNSADNIRGFHDPNGLLVVIDEGQGESVEAVAYDAAFSTATGAGDRILVLGNPSRIGGRFQEISRKPGWHAVRIPASEHPNIREGRVIIPGGPAPDWPETIAQEYGKNSSFYTSFVEAEFPEQSESALVRPESFDRAVDPDRASADLKERIRCCEQGIHVAPAVVGVDVAREGKDNTSICCRWGPVVYELDRWREPDTVENSRRIAETVIQLINAHRIAVGSVVVDETSMGGGVYDQLRRDLRDVGYNVLRPRTRDYGWRSTTVVGFKSSRTALMPERFADLRAQSYWTLRDVLEDECLCFHDRLHPDVLRDLREEVLAHDYFHQGDDRIRVLSKDAVKGRISGRSPDLSDALAMTFFLSLEKSGAKMKKGLAYFGPSRTGSSKGVWIGR